MDAIIPLVNLKREQVTIFPNIRSYLLTPWLRLFRGVLLKWLTRNYNLMHRQVQIGTNLEPATHGRHEMVLPNIMRYRRNVYTWYDPV